MPHLRQKLEGDQGLQKEIYLLYTVVERKKRSRTFYLQEVLKET